MNHLPTCVSCGQVRQPNHKCSARHEAARQAAQTRANNDETFLQYEPMRIQEATRLYAGLAALENQEA